MNLFLNLGILMLIIVFGIYRLTNDNPEKRKVLLNNLKNAPKTFFQNCKIVLDKIKNKEL